jgi:hypothetical protein
MLSIVLGVKHKLLNNKQMANAKEQVVERFGNMEIVCATIFYKDCWDYESPGIDCNLLVGHTQEEYDAFIESLDFEYDNGYGGQELFGNIWFKDGTWASRGEYDGSEWWEHHICPDIPQSLLSKYK